MKRRVFLILLLIGVIYQGDFFNNYIKDGKTMKFNFQIPNNPNYGNHSKANKSIGQ